jgi:nitroreductase
MSMSFNGEANAVLDEIIEGRRTVRAFKPEVPSRESIEAIVHAGLWAPFARMAVSSEREFRKFFIIQRQNPVLSKISDLIRAQAPSTLAHMEGIVRERPSLGERADGYLNILRGLTQNGYLGLADSPCLIVVAEQRGLPPAEQQSLAHAVQNMWLKATALGLGLRLLSVIEILTESEGFCALLGVKLGEYAFTGCVVGYPEQESGKGSRPSESDVLRWL